MAQKKSRPARTGQAKKLELIPAPGFRTTFADGAFIRREGRQYVVTFVQNDKLYSAQALVEKGDGRKEFGPIDERAVRQLEFAARMEPPVAISVATMILDRIASDDPEALVATNVRIEREDPKVSEPRGRGKKR